jgi:hypothetical protein
MTTDPSTGVLSHLIRLIRMLHHPPYGFDQFVRILRFDHHPTSSQFNQLRRFASNPQNNWLGHPECFEDLRWQDGFK